VLPQVGPRPPGAARRAAQHRQHGGQRHRLTACRGRDGGRGSGGVGWRWCRRNSWEGSGGAASAATAAQAAACSSGPGSSDSTRGSSRRSLPAGPTAQPLPTRPTPLPGPQSASCLPHLRAAPRAGTSPAAGIEALP
jgi:hypothetical protein